MNYNAIKKIKKTSVNYMVRYIAVLVMVHLAIVAQTDSILFL